MNENQQSGLGLSRQLIDAANTGMNKMSSSPSTGSAHGNDSVVDNSANIGGGGSFSNGAVGGLMGVLFRGMAPALELAGNAFGGDFKDIFGSGGIGGIGKPHTGSTQSMWNTSDSSSPGGSANIGEMSPSIFDDEY